MNRRSRDDKEPRGMRSRGTGSPRPRGGKHKLRRKRTLFRYVLYAVGGLYALAAVSLLYLRFFNPAFTAVQLQRRIESAAAAPSQRWIFVPLGKISLDLQHATVAAEDSRFYEHHGIDWEEMENAIEGNRRRGRLWRGGSTITQQLVKNLFLTTRGTFLRKAVELPLAVLAELILPKRRILELYLNIVEWGPGVFGAEAAARHYYGVSAADLGRERAARLAACLPAPRSRRPERMNQYAAAILKRMAQMGW